MIKRLLPFLIAPLLLVTAFYLFGGLADQSLAADTPDWRRPLSENELEKAASKMDEALLAELRSDAAEPFTVIVHLGGEADLSGAEQLTGKRNQTAFVVNRLQSHAQVSQADIRAYLNRAQAAEAAVSYRAYFIFNGLAVTADADFLWHLALHRDVERLAINETYTINNSSALTFTPGVAAPESNISQINADDVWTTFGITGTDVVIANVDTGVQYSHPALAANYLGNNNGVINHDFAWYDATAPANTVPYDDNGHGSHTMGTSVGGDGPGPFVDDIGVAPGARWMAVKAFTAGGTGTAADLHSAYEWLIAPCAAGDTPGDASCDPAKAPDIVNNSWGNNNGSSVEFQSDVVALRAAGILPVFSAGNNGPLAGTVGAPASLAESFAVGAVDSSDVIASFSSRGPSPLTNEFKPDISAPGVRIRSAVPNDSYALLDGTSMAAPHVTGMAALMLSADPDIDIDTIERLMRETAVDRGPAGPDAIYGYGRIDAFAAVQRVVESGTIAGIITDDNSAAAIAGADVSVSGNGLQSNTLSAVDGAYTADYLIAGTYTITVDYYGYAFATISGVTVQPGLTTTLDIGLASLPHYVVNGFVYDAISTTLPITNSLITAIDTPVPAVSTNASGWYSLTVAEGDLLLEAAAFGYATGNTPTTILTDTQINFYLNPLPPILLVDDDEGALRSYSPHVESNYLQALDSGGYSYTYWDIEADGAPSFDVIRQYAAVVWFGGEFGRIKDISDAAQADALMQYLDLGGRLFYVAQEHTFYYGDDQECDAPRWGGNGPCPFTEHYLGIADWIQDQKGDVLYGVADNPVGSGLGPYTMQYPPLLADFTDQITGTIAASLAFSVTDDVPIDDVNLVGYSVFSPTAAFKTVYMATPLEALADVDQADVMFSVMEWFGIAGLAEGVSMAPAYQNQIAEPGASLTYTLRLRNLSPSLDSFDLELVYTSWPAKILNAAGTQTITETSILDEDETEDFLVVVAVPAGAIPGSEATIEVQATSQSGTPHTSSAFLTAQAEQLYYLLDSDQCDSGVHFDWVDATSGTRHQLDDNGTFPEFDSEPLPAPFKFYNVDYDEVWFNDHGTILFGSDNVYDDNQPSGTPAFPNPTLLDPNTAIYAAWGNFFWHPADSPADWGVYTLHDASRNWFIIQYHGYGNLLGTFDEFEVILDLNNNEILLQYQTISHHDFANVGLENQFGDKGVVYVIDQEPVQNSLHDNLAVRFGIGTPPINREVALTPEEQSGTGTPGNTVDYTLTISSTSSVQDSFNLEVGSSQWPITFWDAGFNNQISSVGPLDPCSSTDIGVRVTLPDTSTYVDDTAIVRARSQSDALITGNAALTTDNAAPAAAVSPDQYGAGFSRQTVSYTVQISNTGNITDIYDLSLSNNSWPASLVPPTAATGILAPGASQNAVVSVEIPAGAPAGNTDSVTLTATSRNYPATEASAILTTEALPFTDVTIDEIVQINGGPPNWVTGYFITVRNSGNISDTFNLEAIAYDWPTTIWNDSFTVQIDETALLAADETYRVGVRVTIPTTAIGPDQDMVLIRAQANELLDKTAFTTLITEVEPPPSGHMEIDLSPAANWVSALASQVVTYSLTVQNNGSAIQSYDIAISGIEWPTTVSMDTIVDLPAGQTAKVLVSIAVPAGANPGEWDKIEVDVFASNSAAIAAQSHILTFIDTTGSFVPPPEPELFLSYLPVINRP